MLYVQLVNSASVSYAEVKSSAGSLLGMESNDTASDPFSFAVPFDKALRGGALRLVVTMSSGGSYEIVLDVPLK